MEQPLDGIRAVSLATNLPGPAAAMRLRRLGAKMVKVEPPAGDALARANRACYDHLTAGQEIVTLDLKLPEDRARLDAYLEASDLLLTAHRTTPLERLGLGWTELHARFPRLCQVAIVGRFAPNDNVPGHDLNFQAAWGLLTPPHMPKTLVADLGAAERAVAAALGLLLARERGGEAGYAQVSIEEAAQTFALPLTYRLTVDGPLSGALPSYRLYRTRDDYIALAALEPHFLQRLQDGLNVERVTHETLERIFETRTALEWENWARERDIPITALRMDPTRANTSSEGHC